MQLMLGHSQSCSKEYVPWLPVQTPIDNQISGCTLS